MKYILFFPGYIILMLGYFFPKKNARFSEVVESGRQWKHKDKFAIYYTILIYTIIGLTIYAETA